MLVGKKIREDYIQKFCPSGKDDIRVSLASIVFGTLKDRGFRAVLLYRIGRYFRVRGRNLLTAFIERLIHRFGGRFAGTTLSRTVSRVIWKW